MIDARAWLLWTASALVLASSTRNPLYVIILLMAASVVGLRCSTDGPSRVSLSTFRFGLIAVPLAAVFNALTVHVGDTAWFRLPGWIPLLGGPVTLEALTFGAVNGLTLTTIFGSFSVFNRVLPARELIQLTPRAFHETGVVLSISLTFIPQALRSLRRIREAQAVRGHRMHGLRDWPPIIVPLLINSLERSMGLAEAMVARGYGAIADRAQSTRTQVLMVIGLLLLLGGWLGWLMAPTWRLASVLLVIAGGSLILGATWLAGRFVAHTSYRQRAWGWRETSVVLGGVLALTIFLLPLPWVNRDTLYYAPYPRLTLPGFDPLIGFAILGLLIPALVGAQRDTP